MTLGAIVGWFVSCNVILDNEPRVLEASGGAAAGHDRTDGGSRPAGGAAGGTMDPGAGTGPSAGAAGSDGHGGASAGGTASGAESGAGQPGAATSGAGDAGAGNGPTTCPTPADCALAICDGSSCDARGRRCSGGVCACPGNVTSETACADGVDNDCDGLVDCADPNCDHAPCQAGAASRRCCSSACVDLESDERHCQGCGVACRSGESCVLVSDSYGRRGACTCSLTSSYCPGYPTNICRTDTPNSNRCAQQNSSGCAAGQTFVDVTAGPNFCHYQDALFGKGR